MITINIDTMDEGRWFDFFYTKIDPNTLEPIYGDPIENGPRMRLRTPVELFRKRANSRKTEKKYIHNPKSRKMELVESEVELTPEQKKKENDEFVDYVIQDLEGFKLGGKVIKGTLKEKVKMMENPLVSMFVQRCIQIMQESGIQEAEEESKNSSTGSSGKKTPPEPE